MIKRTPLLQYFIIIVLLYILVDRIRYFRSLHRIQSAADIYSYARQLKIDGHHDPECSHSSKYYACAGSCPWINLNLFSCKFLKRQVNHEFDKSGMYCRVPNDHCPNYNAWLKNELTPMNEPIGMIPSNLLSNFTLNHLVPVINERILFRGAVASISKWTPAYLETFRKKIRAREPYGSYESTVIYPVLDEYAESAVRNKNCAVIGTELPWIEAALIEYGASSITTIEYGSIDSTQVGIRTITPKAFAAEQLDPSKRTLFDTVWSYSSIEHDGLGRYGDPINPFGDLQTMVAISCMLKPAGLLFLGIPINKHDSIQFNLHRIYGPIRLPLLNQYFHLVRVFSQTIENRSSIVDQLFIALQNKIGCLSS
jgi:hypothetical protein